MSVSEKEQQARIPMSLDQLLSEKALDLLNEVGFVSFSVGIDDNQITGWFSRKREVTKEMVVISTPCSTF